MSLGLSMLAAVLLDALCGEPRRYHPLVGFGRLANALEAWGNREGSGRRWQGLMAWALAVLPLTLLAALLASLPLIGGLLEILALYAALGLRSLHEHARPIAAALRAGDLPAAQQALSMIVSRDTQVLDAEGVARGATESVLENSSDAVFAALFWFALAGAPGVVLYRLANTLDAMWGYRTARFERFGWAAARLDDLLNYLPARLTALSWALLGQTHQALNCWRRQAGQCASPNGGPVMAAGAGALGVQLGGAACYHGQWQARPVLGCGQPASAQSIEAALALLRRGVLLWLLLILLGGWLYG
ncbi:adenosylcobinamide-phosphate synthase CbiB [Pseudomonas sp. NW5]|uniref:adenosylcobinamide-phosphate synthase CbiB n=1 Tax=Pseudomonas sp. NW5 TaxID=2934934 RepID=UPI0020218540|nr:adenosylcobinamide-phosphate synthase CbiB [Pseudomonas sp. NW5]MCL7462517.1 adenosylcobinamide-phosphate synthase CbiB [Pseudomonas sp. NW5]